MSLAHVFKEYSIFDKKTIADWLLAKQLGMESSPGLRLLRTVLWVVALRGRSTANVVVTHLLHPARERDAPYLSAFHTDHVATHKLEFCSQTNANRSCCRLPRLLSRCCCRSARFQSSKRHADTLDFVE